MQPDRMLPMGTLVRVALGGHRRKTEQRHPSPAIVIPDCPARRRQLEREQVVRISDDKALVQRGARLHQVVAVGGLAREEALERLAALNTRDGISAVFNEVAQVTGNEAYRADLPSRSLIVNVRTLENTSYKPGPEDEMNALDEATYPFSFDLTITQRFESADPMAVVADVRRAVGSVDPELALRDVQPLTDVVSTSWARRRFDATLFTAFGIAALLLAASGIFAVLAHSVASRRREFGIRIALGAHPGRVLRQVLREGMAFPIAGLVLGVGAAVWVTRVLQSLLFEVDRPLGRWTGNSAAANAEQDDAAAEHKQHHRQAHQRHLV